MGASAERVRRSRAEWTAIVEQQALSGLSQAAYCRREQISPASFAQWRSRLRGAGAATEPFVQWRLPQRDAGALEPGELELVLPGGVRLRMRV